jgi:hypothetical protein
MLDPSQAFPAHFCVLHRARPSPCVRACVCSSHSVLALVADPKNSRTKADVSKFHDDRSTWTGVAFEGGPSTIDSRPTLASQTNHDSAADVRGDGLMMLAPAG